MVLSVDADVVERPTATWSPKSHGPITARLSQPTTSASTERIMRIVLSIIGILLVICGGVWFLQGINILPGSFMTGQTKWAVYGGIALIAGIAMLISAIRLKT
ncbi:MAG TPA: hypothetical protein VFC35_06530 [Gemmatimonadaceae bacterium]|nr:hypothetical protein [Gemmatimonadaceae bacterium]